LPAEERGEKNRANVTQAENSRRLEEQRKTHLKEKKYEGRRRGIAEKAAKGPERLGKRKRRRLETASRCIRRKLGGGVVNEGKPTGGGGGVI